VEPRTTTAAAPTAPPTIAPAPGPEFQALASKIKLEVLVWAADPKDRMVFLNGRKYVEGQEVERRVIVERIAEDGVVLAYQGQRLRLQRP
jgi:hypothetical protein